jgi:hypothetical protein
MIACIGWGSLVWDPGELRCIGDWKSDGPELAVEFARVSKNGRLTLVLTPGAQTVPTLWTEVDYQSPKDARSALAARENSPIHAIGLWPGPSPRHAVGADRIASWAAARNIDAVVWTALRPRFAAQDGMAPADSAAAIEYLKGVDAATLAKALEYIKGTPAQVRTGFRAALVAEFKLENINR